MVTKNTSKTKQNAKPKKVQRFVRLNLDDKLELFLQQYESKYGLLNRGDIIRMLLSEIQEQKRKESRKDLVKFLKTLLKPDKKYSEDEIFQILEENDYRINQL